jgi:fatty acid CoA ligase FadD9
MTSERTLKRARELAERDAEVRSAWPSDGALAKLRQSSSSLETLAEACRLYGDRRCLRGSRDLTFTELWSSVVSVASGLSAAGMAAPGERVGICGFPSLEWVLVDLACLYLGAVSVPLTCGGPATDLAGMVRDASVSCLACAASDLASIAPILQTCPSVRTLLLLETNTSPGWEEDADPLRETRRVATLAHVEQVGRQLPAVSEGPASDPDRLRTLVYTSGSGGIPKGAVFPERVWREYWLDPARGGLPALPGIRLASLPLSHIAGRRQLLYSLVTGGVTHFMSTNDMSSLFDEVRRVRPTVMMLVPRVSNLIHQHFLAEQRRRDGRDDEIRAEMRHRFLGDRLLLLITGSAPTAPNVAAFLSDCFDAQVLRGYATTEAGVLTFDERPVSNVLGYRLEDAPSLGYRTTDKPYPRGELLVKTRSMVPGYYGRPDASRDLFSADGYMRTSDIVEQRGPHEIVWIDRAQEVLKLAQGEFVEISRLESLYAAGSAAIRQIYIHGNSLGHVVAAAVVPDLEAASVRSDGPFDAGRIQALLLDEIARIGRGAGLREHEIPRDCLVEMEPFTVRNGLQTESGKLARHRLRAAYGERLDAMCRTQVPPALVSPSLTAATTSIKELVRPLAGSAWRTRDLPDALTLGPQGLALDSMALLELLLACEAAFGVSLTADDLRSDNEGEPTLTRLAALIAERAAAVRR